MVLAAVVALSIGGYALHEHGQLTAQEQRAEAIFYRMKSQDVLFAQLEQRAAAAGASPSQQELAQYMADWRQMETDYDAYAARLTTAT